MTLGDSVLDYINRGPVYPPFALTRALYTLCEELNEPDEIPLRLALGAWFSQGVLPKLPDAFKAAQDEYLAEFKKWDADRDGYHKQPSVPLYELLPIGECIQSIHGHFLYDIHELAPKNLLASLRQQLRKNEAGAHGLSVYQRSKTKVPLPSEMDDEPYELVEKYLHHTPFYPFFCTQVPFRIERARFQEHGFLFARSGHGKTQALRSLVAQFLQEGDPPALFLIDSLGALIEGIEDLEIFNTTLRDRLVILDPSRPQYVPRLNFFGLQSDDMIFYLFKALDQTVTQRQATMISYLMEYMRLLPNPTILQLAQLCESKAPLHNEVMAKLSPFAHAFFQNQFYGKGDAFVQQTKSQIAQRLYTLGRLPKFIEIFSARDRFFDPYECMQSKRIVLINTDARSPAQGGLGEASALFGRFILAQCLEAARRRPKHQRHLALIVCDEAKAYLDDQSALILSDARQYGMGMLLASQQPHQLPEGVRREVNTNTSIRFMGNIEYAVAAQYARDMFCDPAFIIGMKKYDRSHAEWAVHISGMERAVKLRMPYGALEKLPTDDRALEPSIDTFIVHPSNVPHPTPTDPPLSTDNDIPTSAPGGWKK